MYILSYLSSSSTLKSGELMTKCEACREIWVSSLSLISSHCYFCSQAVKNIKKQSITQHSMFKIVTSRVVKKIRSSRRMTKSSQRWNHFSHFVFLIVIVSVYFLARENLKVAGDIADGRHLFTTQHLIKLS